MPRARWLLIALLALAGCSRAPSPASRPNVVLITVESVRTDQVGVYGGRSRTRPEVPITPSLDALAREAVVYPDAHAVTSWTLASHASLLTGLYPSAHQTVRPRDRLDDSYVTVAELLHDAGYQTAAVVSGPYLRAAHNLNQGFELYHDEIAAPSMADAHDTVTNPQVEAALHRFVDEERDPARPFLLFAYFWDPHYDYLPPPPYDRMFVSAEGCEPFDLHDFELREDIAPGMSPARLAYIRSQYAGEIRATDDLLGRFFALLKQRGLWDDTVVIVTADHGEEFFDHGYKGHKHNLYAETVHVPLLVKYPHGSPSGRDQRLVSHVDVFPTILQLAGVAAGTPQHGHSLLAAPPPEDRPVLFELLERVYWLEQAKVATGGTVWGGVRRGEFKLVWKKALDGESDDEGPELLQVFDVAQDPGEQTDLSEQDPELASSLMDVFAERMAAVMQDATGHRAGGTAALSPQETERLRALGYVN